MTGAYHITIGNSFVKYDFTILRNITIIKGDSASGKTILVDMIRDYILTGPDSGITLNSNCPCRVIEGNTWEEQLTPISDSIVFIDEGNAFVISDDFAKYVKAGKNYYVIVTREKLSNLPYSIAEIYGIKSSGKYNNLTPVYHETYRIYEENLYNLPAGDRISPSLIITEDSNAGYDFFTSIVNNSTECVSAGGKANIFNIIPRSSTQTVLVIADGAAFGAEMERLCELIQSGLNLHLYLPESFEWLILEAGIIKEIPRNQIEHAEDYADSCIYFSWEQYFTTLLSQTTRGTHMAYNKNSLNDYYKHPSVTQKVLKIIKGISFNGGQE